MKEPTASSHRSSEGHKFSPPVTPGNNTNTVNTSLHQTLVENQNTLAAVNRTPEQNKEGQIDPEEAAGAKEKLSKIQEEGKEETKNQDEESPKGNIVDKILAMDLNAEQIQRFLAGKDPYKFTTKSSSISGPSSHSAESAEEEQEHQSESSDSDEEGDSSSSEYDDESESSEEESDAEPPISTDYFFSLETQHKDFVRSMVQLGDNMLLTASEDKTIKIFYF